MSGFRNRFPIYFHQSFFHDLSGFSSGCNSRMGNELVQRHGTRGNFPGMCHGGSGLSFCFFLLIDIAGHAGTCFRFLFFEVLFSFLLDLSFFLFELFLDGRIAFAGTELAEVVGGFLFHDVFAVLQQVSGKDNEF